MKRIAAWTICLCLLLHICSVWAQDEAFYPLLSELKIMQGDPDGNMRPEDSVSRAEFAKIAVAASRNHSSAAAGTAVSPFRDVPYTHWAAPYVRAAVSYGYCRGYLDATFRPDEQVLYEEALTMLLKVLGYTEDDFGYSWPYGQIGLAQQLGIADGVEAAAGEAITRGQAAQLVYQTLCTKTKDSSALLLTAFDVQETKEVTLLADQRLMPSLTAEQVYTDQGTFQFPNRRESDMGKTGTLYVKDRDRAVAFVPKSGTGAYEVYIVYAVLDSELACYGESGMVSLPMDNGTLIYSGKTATTYGAVKNTLAMGDCIYISRDGQDIDHGVLKTGSMQGPITAGENWMTVLGTEQPVVFRDGEKQDVSAVQGGDVLYYLPELSMVFAYHERVIGVYEKALPNQDAPQSVVISGVEYQLESAEAFRKLSSLGSVRIGETITALLGRDGKIADVALGEGGSAEGVNVYGYVVGTGTKNRVGTDGLTSSDYYIRLAHPDGTEREYTCLSDYREYMNQVVGLRFTDGAAKLIHVNEQKVTGSVDVDHLRIGSDTIASGIRILDVGTTESSRSSLYTTIPLNRLRGVTLRADDVFYAGRDKDGRITELILNDVSGDSYSYGILTKARNATGNAVYGEYTYLLDGAYKEVKSQGRVFNLSSNTPVRIALNAKTGALEEMSALRSVQGRFEELREDAIVIDGKEYPLSGRVEVYQQLSSTSYSYSKLSVSELRNGEYRNITAYYDKSIDRGGRIRVITVK